MSRNANGIAYEGPGGSTVSLADLDRGRYADAVQHFNTMTAPGPDQDLATQLWYGEMALYLGRIEEAAAAVAEIARDFEPQIGDSGEFGALARRSWLVAAEADCARGRLAESEARASAVSEGAARGGDAFSNMRARLTLGSVAGGKGEYPLALERLAAASRIAGEIENGYYQGRIAHARSLYLLALGEFSAAERRLGEAVELLERTENLLNRASAQVSYGNLLCDFGRFQEAYEMLTKAERNDLPLATGIDPRLMRLAMAKALLGMGRFDEAVSRLEGLLELERAMGNRAGELEALRLLARAELGRGHIDAAERAATAAAHVATLAGSPGDVIDARLLAGRVRARMGRNGASDDLREVLYDVDESGDDIQRAEARIYLAEALTLENPIESAELIEAARVLPIVEATPWLAFELERVDRDRLRAPVRINPDGTLVVDTRLSWPKLKNAREALERYLLERSLDETTGNAAAAGRLIGETRYQMHYLKRIFERGEGRPSRARIPVEEGTERARRSASRPKRLVRRRG